MARALRAWAISEREKTRSVTYITDRENEVSKRYVQPFLSGTMTKIVSFLSNPLQEHEQVLYMKKMLFAISKYLISFQRYSRFLAK